MVLPLLSGRQERVLEMGVGLQQPEKGLECRCSALRGVDSPAPQWAAVGLQASHSGFDSYLVLFTAL